MSVYVVGSPAMTGAFEVAGIPGCSPAPGQSIGELLVHLARDRGVELALVQLDLATGLSEDLLDELVQRWGCLVQEVPGPGDPLPDAAHLRRRVEGVVGGTL
ncbi:MAG: hypothetical protein CL477_09380 [Acidobacteria bacterium]|jgi:vacuolar-type H+-ATPase subunit F/Vma7|nr:hypothetical protein [Acidobacteriota bacterium]MDP7339926.1 hypothetical protein [Vicinamibacterales bacterium]MDP7480653.1 hypothetical protein [Vicinamibacterales bacterium]MDP7690269.1 hypothetical protein [Vicinamibacterales bacterium]HJN46828.1 hypothetical protein [Vicinamibacterales bacterium]|tara:strand:+ start:3771 stop:4076 length:306 start_codon:yes stop_codon:yes gene_type:complete